MMLQHEKCDDFVLATGKCSTVRSVIEKAFSLAGTSIKWKVRSSSLLMLVLCYLRFLFPMKWIIPTRSLTSICCRPPPSREPVGA